MMFVAPVEPGRELLLECWDIRDAPGDPILGPGQASVRPGLPAGEAEAEDPDHIAGAPPAQNFDGRYSITL
jgi:hypothetical protein